MSSSDFSYYGGMALKLLFDSFYDFLLFPIHNPAFGIFVLVVYGGGSIFILIQRWLGNDILLEARKQREKREIEKKGQRH